MKKILSCVWHGKIATMLFTVTMVMMGILFIQNDSSNVKAADSTTKDFVAEQITDITSYRQGDEYTYPKPTIEGAEDYVFAGWYADEACATAYTTTTIKSVTSAYAKYVPAETMDVKFQVAAGTNVASEKTNLRMVSTIDSINYDKVGFSVKANGKTIEKKTTKVFKRIDSLTDGLEYGYSPVIFDTDSEYFTTLTIQNIKNVNFDRTYSVKPFWVTLDGTTVYGCGRNVKVSDSYNGIANVPVRIYADNVAAESTITVTPNNVEHFTYVGSEAGGVDAGVVVTSNNDGSITCKTSQAIADANGMLVNLRFQIGDGAESTEVFTMTGIGASDYTYRVLSGYYDGTGPDTSWYDEFSGETKFVIATANDLYGLAAIVNDSSGDYKSEQFSNDTILMGADITVNKGQATAWSTTEAPEYNWTPIGKHISNDDETQGFAGTFDGQMHTISGVYLDTSAQGAGLFGLIATGGVVSNFSLKNSYFNSSNTVAPGANAGAYFGSIAGVNSGTVSKISSDAIVIGQGGMVGGIVGRMLWRGSVKECWFDGEIDLQTTNGKQSGGIVGYARGNGTFYIEDCLYTGKITTVAYSAVAGNNKGYGIGIGGILGNAYGATSVVNITNCISAGELVWGTTTGDVDGMSVVMGSVEGNYKLNLTNVYGTNESSTTTDVQRIYYQKSDVTPTINGTGTLTSKSELSGYANRSAVNSLGIYTNHAKDNTKAWVITETGVPQLKAFCDEWLDFGWYDEYTTGDYKIETAEEMYAFSLVSKTDQFSGDTVKLVDNIKLNNGTASVWATTENTGITGSLRTWTPIGQTTAFAGTFDGQKHTISGLYINETTTEGVGLFGQVSGKVQNFRLNNSYVNSTKVYTGSVVGFLFGNMDGVYSDAYIYGTATDLGGLVGRFGANFDKTISNSWFAGNVEAAGQYNVGGIVGYATSNNKTINNCLNTGSISGGVRAGGLVGYTSGITNLSLTNCLHMGEVDPAQGTAGAVVGYINGKTTIKNVYTNEDVDENQTNGITGVGWTSVSSNNPITGEPVLLTDAQVTGMNAYINTDLDYYDTDATDKAWAIVSDGTPVIKALYDGKVETSLSGLRVSSNWYYNAAYRSTSLVNETTEYSILDSGDMFGLASIVNGNKDLFANKKIYLEADVDLSQKEWTPIGNATYKFAGTFDGQKPNTDVIHAISGLNINATTQNCGLFGYTASGSIIKNLKLIDSTITNTSIYTGSIVGHMEGNLQNVYSNATVHGNNAYVGGLVGRVTASSQSQQITISECWFEGSVSCGNAYHGGIVGHIYAGTVEMNNCLNTGTVVNTFCDTNSGPSGTYAGAGGLVGQIRGENDVNVRPIVTIKNSINTGEVKAIGQQSVGSVIGRTFRVKNITFENVYSTNNLVNIAKEQGKSEVDLTFGTDSSHFGMGSWSTNQISNAISGRIAIVNSANIKDKQAYFNTDLTFYSNSNNNGVWAAIEGNSPELKKLSQKTIITDFGNGMRNSTDWYYNQTQWKISATTSNNVTSYTIQDEADFYGFAELVNQGVETFGGKTVSLAANINLNGDVTDEIVEAWVEGTAEPTNSWTPIGNATNKFSGTFNGQGCEIRGIYVSSSTNNTSVTNGLGLFGNIDGATIQDIKLKNSYFEYAGTQTITKSTDTKYTGTDVYACIGSIAGYAHQNCTLTDVYSDAVISSTGRYNGGLVGYAAASATSDNSIAMESCWFDGDMQLSYAGNNTFSGGLLGCAYEGKTTLDTCLYSGELVMHYTCLVYSNIHNSTIGGLIGGDIGSHGFADIKNSISDGTIDFYWKDHASTWTSKMGGVRASDIIGIVYNTNSNTDETVLALTEITCKKDVDGASATSLAHACYNNCSNTNLTEIVDATDLIDEKYLYGLGWQLHTNLYFRAEDRSTEGPVWAARAGKNPAPATLVEDALEVTVGKVNTDLSGTGTEQDPYLITSIEELYGFSVLSRTKDFSGEYVALGNNITVNTGKAEDWKTSSVAIPWYVIAPNEANGFAGTFNGMDTETKEIYSISGIYAVDDSEYLGLFGTTLTGSTVKNFKLTDSYFKQTGTGNTGSIAGAVQGTIDSVYTDAIIESAGLYVGGIAAYTSGTIYNIVESSTVETSDTEKTVTATAYRDVVNIKNCWFDGVINATTKTTWARIGGLVGYVSEGRLDMVNCLFTGKIDAQEAAASARVGGFVGTRNSNAKATTSTTSTTDGIKTTTTITSTYADTGEAAYPMLYLVSSIAAGEITVSGNEDTVGSAIGYVQYGKFDDVFVTRDTYPITHSVGATFEKQPIQTYNTDRLIGYCVEPTYGFTLDFANDWSMRLSGVPVPKALESVVEAENIVDDVSTLTAEIGLNTWGKTLAETVDYGMGNYVVSADATYDTYSTYLTTLGTLGFTKYSDNSASDMDEDGVYNAIYTKESGDWVLDITFVAKEEREEQEETGKIHISISTIGKDGLADNLEASDANLALANATTGKETTKDVSFSMLELVGAYGNGFVFKLPNGHFMINDGGKITESDQLLNYLKELADSEKVVIDAWVITHTHEDHCGVAQTIFGNSAWTNSVQLNAIYVTEANDAAKLLEGASASVIEDTNLSFRGLLSLTQEDGVSKPAIYRMHMGERYYFSGLTMDVVQAHEQIPYTDHNKYGDKDTFNYTSTNCVYTLTKTGKKILIGGDSNNVNMRYMMMAYGEAPTTLSNINVFVAYHHGKNTTATFGDSTVGGYDIKATATYEWADYLLKNSKNTDGFKFDAVLFPWYQVYDVKKYLYHEPTGRATIYAGDDDSIVYPYNMTEINQYYIENAEAYYTYGYEDDIDGDGTKATADNRHGTVQLTFTDSGIETTVYTNNYTGYKAVVDANNADEDHTNDTIFTNYQYDVLWTSKNDEE